MSLLGPLYSSLAQRHQDWLSTVELEDFLATRPPDEQAIARLLLLSYKEADILVILHLSHNQYQRRKKKLQNAFASFTKLKEAKP